jgi:hypothetical protein
MASDERQQAARLQASATAFRFLHWALPCFAALYWMAYQWLPDCILRAALMDTR